MKAVKYFMAAALAVLALGCNKEQVAIDGTPDGQEVTVTFTAGLPGTPATKAIGDGTTAKNLVVAVYENNAEKRELASLRKTATFTDLKTTVNFSLVKGKTYNFIFWAQSYDVNAQNGPYDITDLRNIGIKYDGDANDEARDAFFAVRKDVKITGALTETIELKRPFAQVNFGTADYDAAVAAGVAPAKSTISAKDIATVFNPFTGVGTGSATATFTTATAFPTDPAKITVEGNEYQYLAMNYIIPTGNVSEKHVSEITAKFYAADGTTQVGEDIVVPSAPVQANYRTNIVGNLFTDQVIFNVEIKPAFEDPDNNIDLQNISTLAALKALFANGGSAVLMADINVPESVILKGNKAVNLNLGGKTITYAGTQNALFRVEEGKLIIDGDGNLNGGGDDAKERVLLLAKGAESHLIIKNGNFKMGKCTASANDWYDCVYALEGGKIDIYGGTFETEATRPSGKHYILNVYNDKPGVINVYGGKFIGYDPKDGDDYLGGSFVAPGYKSKQISTNPDVWTVIDANLVSTAAELDEAIANAAPNAVIRLGAGTYENVIKVTDNKTITFKPAVSGANVVIAGVNAASNASTSNCVFEDITFDNSIQTVGWFTGTGGEKMPCVGAWGGTYTFKNCKFIVEGTDAKETGVMTWWTHADKPATLTFEGCAFEGKNNHAEARAMQIYGHVNLTVDNCNLTTAKRYAIKYAGNEGFTCTIKNCNVSNCEYTVELGSDLYPGSKYTVNFENNTLASGIADYKIANDENATINGGVAK